MFVGRLGFSLALVVAGALLLPPGTASAQRDEEARIHFNAGASYYSRGEYERALEEFVLAQELSGRTELFYNIALCHQQLGNLPEAAGALESYLTQTANIADRDVIETRLANLRRRIEERDAAEAAARAEAEAAAEARRQAEARGEVLPEPDADSREARPAAPRRPPPAWAYAGFGAAGAGVAMSAVFGGLALQHRNAIEDDCGRNARCQPSDVRRMDRFALVADIGIGVAVAGAVVGVVGLLIKRDAPADDPGDAASASVQVAPLIDARTRTLGLSAGGRF